MFSLGKRTVPTQEKHFSPNPPTVRNTRAKHSHNESNPTKSAKKRENNENETPLNTIKRSRGGIAEKLEQNLQKQQKVIVDLQRQLRLKDEQLQVQKTQLNDKNKQHRNDADVIQTAAQIKLLRTQLHETTTTNAAQLEATSETILHEIQKSNCSELKAATDRLTASEQALNALQIENAINKTKVESYVAQQKREDEQLKEQRAREDTQTDKYHNLFNTAFATLGKFASSKSSQS
jgi:hypothetical protein